MSLQIFYADAVQRALWRRDQVSEVQERFLEHIIAAGVAGASAMSAVHEYLDRTFDSPGAAAGAAASNRP